MIIEITKEPVEQVQINLDPSISSSLPLSSSITPNPKNHHHLLSIEPSPSNLTVSPYLASQNLHQTKNTTGHQQDNKTKNKTNYNREVNELSLEFSKFFYNCACLRRLLYGILFILYSIFLAYAIHKSWHKTKSYCEGVKLLVLITLLTYIGLLKNFIIQPYILSTLRPYFQSDWINGTQRKVFHILCWASVLVIIGSVIGLRCWHQPERLFSVVGYFGFILIGFIGSKHRRSINWNQILWGFTIQLLFGIFVLQTTIGKIVFQCIGEKINTFLAYTQSGTRMVFGYLATGTLKGTRSGNYTLIIEGIEIKELQVQLPELPLEVQNSIFALSGMPVIIFFSFFVSILYHYGVMQIIVKKFGFFLQATVGTTACESISASGNIFLGMCESPLLVKPFLSSMTKSELHAVMTGGFATIAGSVMAAYISFGISASHLLSASVMAAPSALALSKLFYPETEESKTTVKDIKLDKGSERNAIEAGSNGAISAVSLIASILANLIAYISFLTFLDAIIRYFGSMIDIPDLSFKMILSKLFIPIAMMLGVEWADSEQIAGLIGVKMFINEFVAYQELGQYINDGILSMRSQTIATFALCGFANLSSIGIQVGTLSTLAPSRASDLAELAFRAMLTGSIACFTTACVAGMLI